MIVSALTFEDAEMCRSNILKKIHQWRVVCMDCKMPAKDIVMKFFDDHNYSQKFSLNVGVSFLCVCQHLGNEDYWLTILKKCTTDSISRCIALENNWFFWIRIMKCDCICHMKLACLNTFSRWDSRQSRLSSC